MGLKKLSENWIYISLALIFIVITTIVTVNAYNQEKLWNINTISVIGSWASLIGFIFVIKQLFDLESKTDAINKTYSKAVYNLVYNETINNLSRAREIIARLKINFQENNLKGAREDFDILFTYLTELDNISVIEGFEDKIDKEGLSDYISYCQQVIFSIFKDEVEGADSHDDYKKLYELETFLITTNNNLRLA